MQEFEILPLFETRQTKLVGHSFHPRINNDPIWVRPTDYCREQCQSTVKVYSFDGLIAPIHEHVGTGLDLGNTWKPASNHRRTSPAGTDDMDLNSVRLKQ